jgi:hypothetical protein
VPKSSGKIVFWRCPKCEHGWKAKIADRTYFKSFLCRSCKK